MSKLIELPYVPFEEQCAFHLAPQRIKCAVTGARAGKTISAAHEFVDNCILQPGFRGGDIMMKRYYTVVAAAPTYQMMERVLLPMVLSIIPPELQIGRYHQTRHRLLMYGKKGITCIYFGNASDAETWQGQELYGVWIDEFALTKEAMYNEVETRTSTKNGWIILTGTLRRGPGWAQKRIKEFSETEAGQKQVSLHQWATADNPYTNMENLEHIKATMPPKYFARMYLASWDTFVGQIYDEFSRKTHCIDPEQYTFTFCNNRVVGTGDVKVRIVRVAAGVDWGHAHPGVIVVAGKSTDGTWYLLDEVYQSGLLIAHENPTQDTWIKRARVLKTQWDIESFWCDPEDPGNIASFRKAGLPAKKAENAVSAGIMATAQLMHIDRITERPRLYVSRKLSHTIEELVHYQWQEERGGGSKERPVKANDHACDAVRYCMYNEVKRGAFKSEPFYDVR